MKRLVDATLAFSLIAGLCFVQRAANACPFCQATSQTFAESIEAMDVAVYARLVKPAPPIKPGTRLSEGQEIPKAEFEIIEIIKGDQVFTSKVVRAIFFGEAKIGSEFLVLGVDPPNVMWSTPLKISDRTKDYLKLVLALPKDPKQRLLFFQKHLEDDEEALAMDAYDEFAKSPYSAVKAIKGEMDKAQLLEWIADVEIPASRRRLYLTMLGVCGDKNDVGMLEDMIRSTDRKQKRGLDALIGCYLTLKGSEGLPLIEEQFLKNRKSEYADTYAAIMALRFHGTEADIIPRKRILAAMSYMLDRPQLADLVIPDLARWEDWSHIDRLVKLFKDADEETSWVRVPVVNYLRQCPLPIAEKQIKALEKIDPAAVRRANTFFPFGAGAAPGPGATSEGRKTSASDTSVSDDSTSTVPTVDATTTQTSVDVPGVDEEAEVVESLKTSNLVASTDAESTDNARSDHAASNIPTRQVADNSNLWTTVGVPLLVAAGILLLQWRILAGPSNV